MIWPTIEKLREFYSSPLGALACRNIRERIHERWPEVGSGARLAKPEYIAGLGYACPYFMPMLKPEESNQESYRLFCIMPAAQGVTYWPNDKKNLSLMAHEKELPLPDASLDRILVIHAFEYTKEPLILMRELWRVLKPGGKLLIVVPNRMGIWSLALHTPFGHGTAFYADQLKNLLSEALFMPTNIESALFMPPSKFRFMLGAAQALDNLGRKLCKPCGGIIIAEGQKQLYAQTPESVEARNENLVAATD